jgi:hypothetical protein
MSDDWGITEIQAPHSACVSRPVIGILTAEDLDVIVELIETGAMCGTTEATPFTQSTSLQKVNVIIVAVRYVPIQCVLSSEVHKPVTGELLSTREDAIDSLVE